MALQDRIYLSNDSNSSGGGIHQDEQTFYPSIQLSETSAITGATSAQIVPLFIAKANGRITDLQLGLAQTAVSASGFVSGTANANIRINSQTICSTQPAIGMASASAANNRSRTNNATSSNGVITSAVINVASANFSAGDQISYDYGFLSAGSAAAGLGATGLYLGVTVRYEAN